MVQLQGSCCLLVTHKEIYFVSKLRLPSKKWDRTQSKSGQMDSDGRSMSQVRNHEEKQLPLRREVSVLLSDLEKVSRFFSICKWIALNLIENPSQSASPVTGRPPTTES